MSFLKHSRRKAIMLLGAIGIGVMAHSTLDTMSPDEAIAHGRVSQATVNLINRADAILTKPLHSVEDIRATIALIDMAEHTATMAKEVNFDMQRLKDAKVILNMSLEEIGLLQRTEAILKEETRNAHRISREGSPFLIGQDAHRAIIVAALAYNRIGTTYQSAKLAYSLEIEILHAEAIKTRAAAVQYREAAVEAQATKDILNGLDHIILQLDISK